MVRYSEIEAALRELQDLRASAFAKAANSADGRRLRDEAVRIRNAAFAMSDPRAGPIDQRAGAFLGGFEKSLKIDEQLSRLGDAALSGDPRYEDVRERLIDLAKRFAGRR